jgi:hypothetical protein
MVATIVPRDAILWNFIFQTVSMTKCWAIFLAARHLSSCGVNDLAFIASISPNFAIFWNIALQVNQKEFFGLI